MKQSTDNLSDTISEREKEICLVVAGSVDSGKSSFIGVIANNILDDGKGLARNTIARHPHEITTGRTSDITSKTLKYGNKNLTLVDLCGHEKYLKTTLFGMTGLYPDYGVLIVAANRGLLTMTKEHLGILLYMKIPFTVIITRVDITPKNIYEMTVNNINKVLKKYKKKTIFINTVNDYDITDQMELNDKMGEAIVKIDKLIPEFKHNRYMTPIISISNKTGYYIPVIKHFLNKLESRQVWESELKEGSMFYIDSKFTPVGIGLVVSGIVRGDPINVGTEMLIGPMGSNGEFKRIKVWSLHNNNREQVKTLYDRERGCLAIKILEKKEDLGTKHIRKGTIIISKNVNQNVGYQFTADIEVLSSHSTVISPHYTPVVHCGSIRQTARIMFEEDTSLKLGDIREVGFRFFKDPEFIEVGTTFFFREGKTRGVGKIKDVLLLKDDPNPMPTRMNARRRKKGKKNRFLVMNEEVK